MFAIAASSPRSLWVLAPAFIILTVSVLVLAFVFVGTKTARFEVSSSGLRLRGDFYGRLIPPDALVVEDVRRVDFARSPELEPKRRTMGTGFPDIRPDGFDWRAAKRRSSIGPIVQRWSTCRRRTANSLIVSPDDPERFMAALREIRGR